MNDRDLSGTEDRVRRAVSERAAAVPATADDRSLAAIRDRLGRPAAAGQRRRYAVAAAAVAAVVAVLVGVTVLTGDDGPAEQVVSGPGTTEPDRPVTSAPATPAEPTIWPLAGSPSPFPYPEDAALTFAREYLGLTSAGMSGPVEEQGDDAVVRVVPFATGGPVTEVRVVRRDGSWAVTGAESANIQVATPTPGAALTSPLAVSGSSTAFEATINLELRSPATGQRLGDGAFTMGGANGEFGPFSAELAVPGGVEQAVLVLSEPDASGQGAVSSATVVLVGAGADGGPAPGTGTGPADGPARFVAWNDRAELWLYDRQGTPLVELAQTASPAFGPVDFAAARGLAAWGDRDFTDDAGGEGGQCGRSITFVIVPADPAVAKGPPPPSKVCEGDHPALSPDGTRLAYVDLDGRVRLTDLGAGAPSFGFETEGTFEGVDWVSADQLLVGFDGDQYVSVGEVLAPLVTGTPAAARGRFGSVAFYDGTDIASIDPDEHLAAVERGATGTVTRLVRPVAPPTVIDADESGRHLLWVDTNGDLWAWSGAEPTKLGTGFVSAAW
ncbi:MAG: Gmad2 immunoglobulin-like domain-containing protein [Acidimicrobiia bacterium]